MGTIERIRQFSPYAFVAFAILFIVFMVLSDNITTLSTGQGDNPQTAAICEINGENIYYKDYEARVKQRIEQMQMQQAQQNPNEKQEINEQQIRNQVWNEMLDELLVRQASEKFGILVTDEEVADILIESPPDFLARSFTDTAGNFNRQLYLELITNPEQVVNYMGKNPDEIDPAEKERQISNFRNELIAISDYIKMQKMNAALTSTVNAAYAVSSPSYIEEKYISDNSEADINYIYLGINTVTDSITVSDDEIKAYYEKHKSSFKTKDLRKVKTLYFMLQPSAEDSARMTNKINRITNDLTAAVTDQAKDSIFSIKMNEYTGMENDWMLIQDVNPMISGIIGNMPEGAVLGPVQLPDAIYFFRVDGKRRGEQEVVRASHILINFNNNKDSAKAETIRILKEAKSGDFAAAASKYSSDKGSAVQGGDLGYFGKGRMVPEFEQAAFGANVGSIVGPVESQFGYHIIKITDKKSEEIKYSTITFAPTISGATKNKIKRDAFAAMKQIESGQNIDSLAVKLNVRCEESPFIDKRRPYQSSMYLTGKIYEAKLGDVLEPQELPTVVIVSQVAEIRKAGIATLEESREQIIPKVQKIKKLDIVGAKIKNIYNTIASNATLDAVMAPADSTYSVKNAQIKNNGFIPGMAQDFAATAQSFKLPLNKINEPVRGENGYFIIEIKSRSIPEKDKAKDAVDVNKTQYTRNLFDIWFNKFKEDADIVDLRSKYYTEY